MLRFVVAAVVVFTHGQCWWFSNGTEPQHDAASERWKRFQDRFPQTEAFASHWYSRGKGWYDDFRRSFEETVTSSFDLNLWMIVDTLAGFFGWAIFGNAWGGVKTGCRRLLQILVVLTSPAIVPL